MSTEDKSLPKETQDRINRVIQMAVDKGWIITKKPRRGGKEITFKDLLND